MTRAPLSWRALAALGLLAFAARAGYVALGACRPGAAITPDSVGYVQLAANLVERHAFSQAAQAPFAPDTIRTPAYPLFLALFCRSKQACPDVCGVLLGQAMLGALAVLLCAAAALVLFGRPGLAVLAGVLLAVDLGSIFHAALVLSDVPFQLAFLAGFFALACGLRLGLERAPVSVWGAAGLLLGAAALVRPIGLFYAPFAGAALWLEGRPKRSKAALRAAFVVLAGSCVLPGLWAARNGLETGDWTVTSLPARDMARQRAAAVLSQMTGEPFGQASADVMKRMEAAHGGPFSSVEEQAEFGGRWGTLFVLSHPVAAAEVAAKDAVRMLGGHGLEIPCWQVWADPVCDPLHPPAASGPAGSGTRYLLRAHPALRPVFAGYELYLVLLYAFAALGLSRAWRSGERGELALVLSPIVYFLLTSVGALAYHRFRLPFLPLVCILAARGAADVRLLPRRKR